MNELNRNFMLDHLNLTVKDFDKTAKWYSDIFGHKLVEQGVKEDGSKWGILSDQKSHIAITERELKNNANEGYNINHFGFKVQNLEKFKAILKKFKLKTYYNSPIHYPHSISWYIEDPSGHEIEFSYWPNDKITF